MPVLAGRAAVQCRSSQTVCSTHRATWGSASTCLDPWALGGIRRRCRNTGASDVRGGCCDTPPLATVGSLFAGSAGHLAAGVPGGGRHGVGVTRPALV